MRTHKHENSLINGYSVNYYAKGLWLYKSVAVPLKDETKSN